MFTSENTRSFPGIFPGIFGKIFGEIFREFSEFVKFPRNFSENFLGFLTFSNNKNIDFSAATLLFMEKTSRFSVEFFRENFSGIFGIYKIPGSFPKTCREKPFHKLYQKVSYDIFTQVARNAYTMYLHDVHALLQPYILLTLLMYLHRGGSTM